MNDLLLKEFTANSFGGINSDSPVIISFAEARKNQGITLIKGDMGTGKSSTLMALMSVMGATFNFDTKNLINQKDETINVSLDFEYNGVQFKVMQSGSRITLKRYYKETDRWLPEGTPKETLREMFGNLGVSPMFLKDLPGKKQIEWFKSTFGTDEEATKEELKRQKALLVAIDQRKEVNRIIKSLTGYINESEMYKNYESNQKKFSKPISIDKEKQKLESLQEEKNNYDRAVTGIEGLKQRRDNANAQIKRLLDEVKMWEEQRDGINTRIDEGEKYIKEHGSIEKEYQAASTSFVNISKLLAQQNEWKQLLAKEKELDECEQSVIQVNGNIDKLRKELLDLTATYLPKIKGLEIRTKGLNIDNEDDDEGIYYQGKSMAQLSESELVDLFLQIWEEKNVSFVFLENVSSFGSKAIATLNCLVKEKKARIFASEMDRSKKEMSITFETKIQ